MSEDAVLEFPVLQDGVLAIGDLWDCRSSSRVGFNLFANNLNAEHVLVLSGSTGSSELRHVKNTSDSMFALGIAASVSAELLGGILKISGGLDFEMEESKKLATETIQWVAERQTYTVQLSADQSGEGIDGQVDKRVLRLIKTGLIRPTHVVKKIYLGGKASGSIKISQTNTGNKYRVGAFLAGEINLYVASAEVRAEMSVSEEVRTSNYETRVNLKSVPPLTPPVEITDFLLLPNEMHKKMDTENHYPEFENSMTGIPYKFELVPIRLYVKDLPEEYDYLGPAKELVEAFATMLGEIRDYGAGDCLKRLIVEERSHILKLLSDPRHTISLKIAEEEAELQEKLNASKSPAIEAYITNKSSPAPSWKPLQDIVDSYKSKKFDEQIAAIVETFKTEGDDELRAVNIDERELDEKCPLTFFTDKEKLTSWMRTDSTIKVLIRTRADTKESDIQLRLYKMSIGLGAFGAQSGIAYPSLSEEDSEEGREGVIDFLTIKTRNQVYRYNEDNELAIATLEASVGLTTKKQAAGRAFGVYAEMLGIPLPMSDRLEHVTSLISFLKLKTNGVEIINSRNETLAKMKENGDTSKFKYVVTTDALRSITDNVPCLQYFAKETGELIIGTYENLADGLFNAPNVFVCHESQLVAICFDYLDTMILMGSTSNEILQDDYILRPTFMQTNCLSPSRLEFAERIASYFLKIQEREIFDSIPQTPLNSVTHALEVATALLEDQMSSSASLATALALIVKKDEFFPELKGELELPGWDVTNNKFDIPLDDADGWLRLHGYLLQFLYYTHEPLLGILNPVISDLEVFYSDEIPEDIELKPVDPDPVDPDPEDPDAVWRRAQKSENVRDELVKIIKSPLEHCPDDIKTRICQYILDIRHSKVLARFCADVYKEFLASIIGAEEKYFHFNNLVDVVKEVAENAGLSRMTQQEMLAEYVFKMNNIDPEHFPNALAAIHTQIRKRALFTLVRHLAACNSGQYFYLLHREIERFSGTHDWRHLVHLFEQMHKEQFPHEVLAYIWGSPKFEYLIMLNSSSTFVLEAILEFQCMDGIPSYIPQPIKELLLPLWSSRATNGNYKWPQVWTSRADVLEAFRIFSTRKRLPVGFASILLRNMLSNGEVLNDLRRVGALMYWDGEHSHFSQPWDLATVRHAINAILDSQREPVKLKKLKEARWDPFPPIQTQSSLPAGRLTLEDFLEVKNLDCKWDLETFALKMAAVLKRFGSPLVATPLARVELITYLMNISDSIVIRELCRLWSKFPIAMPLVIKEFGKDTSKNYRCILPTLQGLRLPDFNKLFAESHRFIVVLRAGSHPDSNVGKSSMLNQYFMKDLNCFASRLDSGSKSEFLEGFVEFVNCSKDTCNADFWNDIKRAASHTPVLLANLHGNAISLPTPLLKLLSKLATATLIFWMPQTYAALQKEKRQLKNTLGDISNVFDVCLDFSPEESVKIPPSQQLSTNAEAADENARKLRAIISYALEFPPIQIDLQELLATDFSPVFLQDDTSVPETKELLALTTKVWNVKERLQLQRTEHNTVSQVEELFLDEFYVNLVAKFCQILMIVSNEKRALAIAMLSEELAHRSRAATKAEVRYLEKLLGSLVRKNNDKNFAVEDIKRCRNLISNKILTIQHFFSEIGRIHDILPEKLELTSARFDGFPSIAADLLLNSFSLLIPSSKTGFITQAWFDEAIGVIGEIWPNLNVFVVSVLGAKGVGKSTLLRSIFGSCFGSGDREVSFSNEGITMRLIFLEQQMREALTIDAILVLDSEGICRLEEHRVSGKPMDRKFAALLLSISNITILTTGHSEQQQGLGPVADALEIALLCNTKLHSAFEYNPNILVANLTPEWDMNAQMQEMLSNIQIAMTNHWFEIGAKTDFHHRYWKINQNLESGELVQDIRSLFEMDSAAPSVGYHEDIVALYRKILKRASGEKTTLTAWCNNFKNAWAELAVLDFLAKFKDADQIGNVLRLQKSLDVLRTKIDYSMQYHCAENESLIFTEMFTILRDEADDSELSGGSVKRNILIEIAARVDGILEDCEFENGARCDLCIEALKTKNAILEEFKSNEDTILTTIKDYLSSSKDAVIAFTKQYMTALEVKPRQDEMDLSVKTNLKSIKKSRSDDDPEGIFLTFRQQISTNLHVIPSRRSLMADLLNLHPNLRLDLNVGCDYIEFEPAFDTNYLSYGPYEEKYLTWREGHWLLNSIDEIPAKMLLMWDSRIYQNGMLRELKAKVNDLLAKLAEERHMVLLPEFAVKAHGYGIEKLLETLEIAEENWNKDYNPITIIEENREYYLKELSAFATT